MKKFCFFVSFLLFFIQGRAQPFELYIDNRQLTSPNSLEFDLYIRNSDSASLLPLKYVQAGYRFNPAFINGGLLTGSYVQGSSELETTFGKTWGFSFNASQHVLNQSANVGSVCPGALIGTSPRKIARFRVVNTVNWGCADDSISFVKEGTGILRLAAVKYITEDCSDPSPVIITSLVNAYTRQPNYSMLKADAVILPPDRPCDTFTTVNIIATGGALPYSGTGLFAEAFGMHNYYVSDSRGCRDSVSVRINAIAFQSFFHDTACEKYILPWGNLAVESGSYSYNYITAQGCDSLVTAHITIRQPSSGFERIDVTPSQLPYYWNDIVCSAGGIFSSVLKNMHGCDSLVTLQLTVLDSCSPRSISTSSGRNQICSGETITLTVNSPLPHGSQWRWYNGGCASGPVIGRGASIRVSPKVTTEYFVKAHGGNCGYGSCASIRIIVQTIPSAPASITGSRSGLCLATGVEFIANPTPAAQFYEWHLPGGATILSGQGTQGITASFSSQLFSTSHTSSSNICVKAGNACGISSCRNLSVSLKPNAAATIEGPDWLFPGQEAEYVSTVFGSTGYTWSVASGWTILSGQGTAAIRVRAGPSNGFVKLIPSNACGTGNAGSKFISVSGAYAKTAIEAPVLIMSPVPARDRIRFICTGPKPERILIMDVAGSVLINMPWTAAADVSALPTGNYIVRFYWRRHQFSRMFSIIK